MKKDIRTFKNTKDVKDEIDIQIRKYSNRSILMLVLCGIYAVTLVVCMLNMNIATYTELEQAKIAVLVMFGVGAVVFLANTIRKIGYAHNSIHIHEDLEASITEYRKIAIRRTVTLVLILCIPVACMLINKENALFTAIISIMSLVFMIVHDIILTVADTDLAYLMHTIANTELLEMLDEVENNIINFREAMLNRQSKIERG